ncbi:hypothetical protein DFS34DRAFT_652634 [Phlyctochytrium arcticum]|nr:hypothetical protein DFS34DRAFT_652634 [Phlyctochytrium arcticum]
MDERQPHSSHATRRTGPARSIPEGKDLTGDSTGRTDVMVKSLVRAPPAWTFRNRGQNFPIGKVSIITNGDNTMLCFEVRPPKNVDWWNTLAHLRMRKTTPFCGWNATKLFFLCPTATRSLSNLDSPLLSSTIQNVKSQYQERMKAEMDNLDANWDKGQLREVWENFFVKQTATAAGSSPDEDFDSYTTPEVRAVTPDNFTADQIRH